MERMKATDFPPEVLKLFDGYVHGRMSRRDFLDGAGKFAVGGFTATAMLEALRPNYAWAQQVAERRCAHQDGIPHLSVAAGLGHHARLFRETGERQRQIARRRGHP